MRAPIEDLFNKATINGFFKKKLGRFVPTYVGWLINLDHADIIRYYNSVIRGNLNYYSFANNRAHLGSFIHGLKWSCARTLVRKFNLKRASKAFCKFDSFLECPVTKIKLTIPFTFKAIKEFNINPQTPDEILNKRWHTKLTNSNLKKRCTICGSSDRIEMYHVRKIWDLKEKIRKNKIDFFTAQMAAINRRQVPLCLEHHWKLHRNQLSVQDKILFKDGLEALKKLVK